MRCFLLQLTTDAGAMKAVSTLDDHPDYRHLTASDPQAGYVPRCIPTAQLRPRLDADSDFAMFALLAQVHGSVPALAHTPHPCALTAHGNVP